MTREEMISHLCFRDEGMYLNGKLPTRFVTVSFRPEDFTDDELALLVRFTNEKQEAYHRRCANAKFDWADNFISFERDQFNGRVRWGRKRRSWREGNMFTNSLPEAIAAFWCDRYQNEQVGEYVLLDTGEIAHIYAAIPYAERVDRKDFRARLAPGSARPPYTEILLGRYDRSVVIAGTSLADLGSQMVMAMRHRIAASRDSDENAEDALRSVIANCPISLVEMWKKRVRSYAELTT